MASSNFTDNTLNAPFQDKQAMVVLEGKQNTWDLLEEAILFRIISGEEDVFSVEPATSTPSISSVSNVDYIPIIAKSVKHDVRWGLSSKAYKCFANEA